MRDTDGWTPLHWACVMGHKEVVQYFVEEVKCDVGESSCQVEPLPLQLQYGYKA